MITAAALLAALQIAALFPKRATIIEAKTLPASAHPNRSVVIWMTSAESLPRPCPRLEDWGESCRDQTRGCYFHGALRVSLVDTKAQRVINTIRIADPPSGDDAFDVPFKVLSPGPYKFDTRTRRPVILDFRDYNGDGKAIEFALFDAITCSDLYGTLIGYSIRRDAILNYEVQDGVFVTTWPEGLFNRKPVSPGFWRYTTAYPPGPREVPRERCTVRYLPDRERFESHCMPIR